MFRRRASSVHLTVPFYFLQFSVAYADNTEQRVVPPETGEQVGSYRFAILINGKPPMSEDAGRPTAPSDISQLPCPQSDAPCDARVRPSVAPPTGNCDGPPAFVSMDEVTYYTLNTLTGQAATNCDITVTILGVGLDSGGHCHDNETKPSGNPPTGTVLTGNTGADGMQFKVMHTWPPVSGMVVIEARKTPGGSCPGGSFIVTEFFNICIRGPDPDLFSAGLEYLGDGPGYERTGGPDNATRHPSHHFGTPAMVAALRNLALDRGAPLFGRPLLGYNDLSLQWGGVFDIEDEDHPRPPNWTPPHCGHRFGRNVDLRISNLTLEERLLLERVAEKRFKVGIEGDHWHLTLK